MVFGKNEVSPLFSRVVWLKHDSNLLRYEIWLSIWAKYHIRPLRRRIFSLAYVDVESYKANYVLRCIDTKWLFSALLVPFTLLSPFWSISNPICETIPHFRNFFWQTNLQGGEEGRRYGKILQSSIWFNPIEPSKKPSDHSLWQPKCSALLGEVFPTFDLLTSLPMLPDLPHDSIHKSIKSINLSNL